MAAVHSLPLIGDSAPNMTQLGVSTTEEPLLGVDAKLYSATPESAINPPRAWVSDLLAARLSTGSKTRNALAVRYKTTIKKIDMTRMEPPTLDSLFISYSSLLNVVRRQLIDAAHLQSDGSAVLDAVSLLVVGDEVA